MPDAQWYGIILNNSCAAPDMILRRAVRHVSDYPPVNRWNAERRGTMTDETQDNGANAENLPQFNVLGQFTKDLSFENPNAPQILRQQITNANLKVHPEVGTTSLGDDVYEVTLGLNATAECEHGVLYNVELVYAGIFRLKNLPEDALQPVLHIQCPSLLFPFVRRQLAELTQEGGFPPLFLDPIDFATLYRHQLMARQDEMAASQKN
jgi:preprotein translocase subunit SecB